MTSTNLPEHQRLVEKIKEMEDDAAGRFLREQSAEKEIQPPKFITELQTYLDLTVSIQLSSVSSGYRITVYIV